MDVDEASIRRFLRDVPAALDLRSYGEASVFAPGALGRESNEGYDAFVPLIGSGISLYGGVRSGPIADRLHLQGVRRTNGGRVTREYFAMVDAVLKRF